MTEKRLRQLFSVWQERLGLQAWDVTLNFAEPCIETADATATISDTYDRAVVRLDKDWKKWDEPFAGRIAAHELLHLVTRDLDRVMADLDGEIHRDVFTQVNSRFNHEIEGVIDRLAVRLVALAPV